MAIGGRLDVFGFLIAILVAMHPGAGRAADTYWQHDPATPGNWYDPANWTMGAPASGMAAYIDNGGTASISGGSATAGQVCSVRPEARTRSTAICSSRRAAPASEASTSSAAAR